MTFQNIRVSEISSRLFIGCLVLALSACGGSSSGSSQSSSQVSSGNGATSSSATSGHSSSETSEPSSSTSSSHSSADAPTRVESGLSARLPNNDCLAPERPSSDLGSYTFRDASPPNGLDGSIFLAQPPGENDRYYILERPGRVKSFMLGDSTATLAIDFSSEVTVSGEGGALGMAFHPDFSSNRYVYIFLTATRQAYSISDTSVSMVSIVRRYTVSGDGLSFSDPTDILAPLDSSDTRLNHQATNHKGGWIGFSPVDGYLYIATGDKGVGAGGVPLSNNFSHESQDLNTLHGKILRIDVDGEAPYAIPNNNPFAQSGGAPEIYAWGLRNPWRASFDRETGDLWVGDVGEGDREEINKIELGGDYGWPFREGLYDRCNGCSNGVNSLPPVVDLSHDDGWVAVIGGYVYRGQALPELRGHYIFGDFIRSGVTHLTYDQNAEPVVADLISGGAATTFSEDNAGEIWRVYSWGGLERLEHASTSPEPQPFPQTLSETGCFDADNPRQVVDGVVAYDLNSPLWSDGADKARYFALPDNTHIDIQSNGQWAFPIGSVLIKTFLLNEQPIETRFLVRHEDGDWGGYSYEWNETGTDASLLTGGKTKIINGQTWRYPSGAQCMNCHTAPNGELAHERVLGLETAQLNRDLIYPGNLIAHQIQSLASVDYFTTAPAPIDELAHMPALNDDTATLELRARAYLHTNCNNCHQPNGPGRGDMDFRYTTPVASGGYCNQIPSLGNLGINDARLLKPGAAAESILIARMERLGAQQMPPLSVHIADDEAITLLSAWINTMAACP